MQDDRQKRRSSAARRAAVDRVCRPRWLATMACAVGLLCGWRSSLAQEQPANPDAPRVLVSLPLGLPAGATTRLKLRGLKLEGVTAIKLSLPGAAATLISSAKADAIAGYEPPRVGDTQVELDITLPPELPEGPLLVTLATPAGETEGYELLLHRGLALVAETEPDDGFRLAQSVAVGQVLEGVVQQSQDVDVFRFEAQAGERLMVEVVAAQRGSALDPLLTLYDAGGHTLAVNDDFQGADARLDITFPQAGVYYIALQDALDQGSAAHVYRLLVTRPSP